MNKKTRKIKKDVKRNLISIGYKKACRDLKNSFYQEFKTAIFDSSYFTDENPSNFHQDWSVCKHPVIIIESEWGRNSNLASLNINKLSKEIACCISKNTEQESYIVECYHPKSGFSWVTF